LKRKVNQYFKISSDLVFPGSAIVIKWPSGRGIHGRKKSSDL